MVLKDEHSDSDLAKRANEEENSLSQVAHFFLKKKLVKISQKKWDVFLTQTTTLMQANTTMQMLTIFLSMAKMVV